ncbi:MAG: V-type ATP synthase subunit A, partial [Alistipes sp.]|nr:V-type ATP synthase subunit A [Alistipes sp.]
MEKTGRIYGINGPVIYIKGKTDFIMGEMVYVSEEKLVGEVISLNIDMTTIQVYEDTTGLKPGDMVYGTDTALFVTLAPGILNNIFDGIQRPLKSIADNAKSVYINRGISVDSLDTEKKWDTYMQVKVGDTVFPGTVIANVPETKSIVHKVMVPPNTVGVITSVKEDGAYTIDEELVVIQLDDGTKRSLTMTQKWPIRVQRPVNARQSVSKPLVTGQRILDTLFPIAKGGTACVPGGFGTGKTMTQHQIAKWSDADIIVYIGCGERGNEMTQVLEDFSKLPDPKTGNFLMDRTTLIANTSNMPVAAREASIYTGLTLAEYYRDMGYHVAIMADSTSRWAEALRELSGRLEEMPAEEGFPAAGNILVAACADTLAVAHLTDDTAVGRGDAFDGVQGAVGVECSVHGGVAVQVNVLGSDLTTRSQLLDQSIGSQELAFAVGDGDIDDVANVHQAQPGRLGGSNPGLNDTALVACDGVEGQGGAVCIGVDDLAVGYQAQLDQCLEAVADTAHQTVAVVQQLFNLLLDSGVAEESSDELCGAVGLVAAGEAAGDE